MIDMHYIIKKPACDEHAGKQKAPQHVGLFMAKEIK
jgi:hypothetical protein